VDLKRPDQMCIYGRGTGMEVVFECIYQGQCFDVRSRAQLESSSIFEFMYKGDVLDGWLDTRLIWAKCY